MTREQVQANPTHDKPAERLELAGSDALGPILRGLGGRITIEIERDEILDQVRIFSAGSNNFNRQLLQNGSFTNLTNGRRQWDADIVYGIDTDYGISGARAVRNYLEWTIRKRGVVNPSGSPAVEKAYSSGDTSAIRGLSDAQLRRNRPFFSPRNYSAGAFGSVAGDVLEASGLAWSEDSSALWVVSDDRQIAVYDRELSRLQDVIPLPSARGFADTEAIVYLGSDRFAVLDEGALGSRPARLHLFHLKLGETVLPTEGLVTYTLSKVEEFAGGLGAEGLAYDRVNRKFYVGTQPTGDGQGGLWEVDIHTKDTDDEPTQTLLYRWYDTLISPGHLASGAFLGDLYYSHEIAGGQLKRSLLCHFRTPDGGGAQGMRRVIQFDIDSGLYIDDYLHNLDGKWEGFTASPGLEDLFFAREGGGQNIQRHDHSQNEEKQTFRRQFFVKDLPTSRALYLNSQEAQAGEAWVFANPGDANIFAPHASVGINILPTFNDEFFLQHEYEGNLGWQVGLQFFVAGVLETRYGAMRPNRYAQTLRNVGGAKTVEVFRDSNFHTPVVTERLIETLGGYYWENVSLGSHLLTIRLRADWASPNWVDITGHIRFRRFSCPQVPAEGEE